MEEWTNTRIIQKIMMLVIIVISNILKISNVIIIYLIMLNWFKYNYNQK